MGSSLSSPRESSTPYLCCFALDLLTGAALRQRRAVGLGSGSQAWLRFNTGPCAPSSASCARGRQERRAPVRAVGPWQNVRAAAGAAPSTGLLVSSLCRAARCTRHVPPSSPAHLSPRKGAGPVVSPMRTCRRRSHAVLAALPPRRPAPILPARGACTRWRQTGWRHGSTAQRLLTGSFKGTLNATTKFEGNPGP